MDKAVKRYLLWLKAGRNARQLQRYIRYGSNDSQ
jgi:hypothetical protein